MSKKNQLIILAIIVITSPNFPFINTDEFNKYTYILESIASEVMAELKEEINKRNNNNQENNQS